LIVATAHALIIDDNASNLGVLAQLLTLEGVSYTRILDPYTLPSALAELPETDIVFLDLEFPRTDGFAIFDQLQADGRFAAVPIVAYTVHVSEINTARERGFHSFLAKPLDADAFPDQLARILRGERVWTRG
jgi:two-component system cell cycle response regulator DivK